MVPRLGISFSLGPIKVLGQAYVALTPGAFMAGIALQATFDAGPISAWFTAGLDFLIAWAPFHYQAHAWVAIGCKVDLGLFSLRIQIGADLQIWGPPFGGQAIVDLDVVSFTIAFGAPATPAGTGGLGDDGRQLPAQPARLTHAAGRPDDPARRGASTADPDAAPDRSGLRRDDPGPAVHHRRASTGSSTAIISGFRSAPRCRSTTRVGYHRRRERGAAERRRRLRPEMLVRAIRAGGPPEVRRLSPVRTCCPAISGWPWTRRR